MHVELIKKLQKICHFVLWQKVPYRFRSCTERCEKINSRAVKKFRRSCARIFRSCTSSSGENELSFQPSRFYRRKNYLSNLPAISYDSNFVFPLAGNASSTLKKYRNGRPGSLKKPVVRVTCKLYMPISQNSKE